MDEKIDILVTASEYIKKLNSAIITLTEYFQSGDYSKGSALTVDIAEGLKWVLDVVILTKDIQKENIEIDEINEKLNEIVIAFENEDYILIGDLFQYEIYPLLEDIKEKINKTIC